MKSGPGAEEEGGEKGRMLVQDAVGTKSVRAPEGEICRAYIEEATKGRERCLDKMKII
jgi:hypothetical protein